jgi:hypothetical protein
MYEDVEIGSWVRSVAERNATPISERDHVLDIFGALRLGGNYCVVFCCVLLLLMIRID